MKITYYGTGGGAGVPELFCSCRVCEYARAHRGKDLRTRSQATVDHLMLDCSVDCFARVAFYGLDMRAYRDVLITHTHFDHYSGDDMISRYTDERNWTFYIPKPACEKEKARTQASVAASKTKPDRRAPDIAESVPFATMNIGGARVTPLPAEHARNIGSVLYLIENKGKNLLWAHDSGLLLPETVKYLKARQIHLDAASLDCNLGRGKTITKSHMDILQCAETKKLLQDIGCADENTVFILSHIGHLLELTHDELCEEAQEFGFVVAYDQMELEV